MAGGGRLCSLPGRHCPVYAGLHAVLPDADRCRVHQSLLSGYAPTPTAAPTMAPGTAQAWFGRISPRFGPPVRVNVFSDVTMAMVLFTVVLIWPEFGIGWFGTGGFAADEPQRAALVVVHPEPGRIARGARIRRLRGGCSHTPRRT